MVEITQQPEKKGGGANPEDKLQERRGGDAGLSGKRKGKAFLKIDLTGRASDLYSRRRS